MPMLERYMLLPSSVSKCVRLVSFSVSFFKKDGMRGALSGPIGTVELALSRNRSEPKTW
jgi:hypothetical protein